MGKKPNQQYYLPYLIGKILSKHACTVAFLEREATATPSELLYRSKHHLLCTKQWLSPRHRPLHCRSAHGTLLPPSKEAEPPTKGIARCPPERHVCIEQHDCSAGSRGWLQEHELSRNQLTAKTGCRAEILRNSAEGVQHLQRHSFDEESSKGSNPRAVPIHPAHLIHHFLNVKAAVSYLAALDMLPVNISEEMLFRRYIELEIWG